MKTYIDKLRECPIDFLKEEIERQRAKIKIDQRDLETMESVLVERMSRADDRISQ